MEQRRFAESAPLLIALADASARGVVGTGPRRNCRIIRIRGAPVNVDVFLMGRLCAQVEGYNLQAPTRLAANDRDGLERMARYLARPPIATDRLPYATTAGWNSVMQTGTKHFAGCKGGCTLQLHRIGPWGITYVNPADDPRNAAEKK
jgi:Putative transposase